MSSKLLGALALGVGSNALLGGMKGPMAGKTPGFFPQAGDSLKTGIQKGFQSGVEDLAQQGVQQGLKYALGFEQGGMIHPHAKADAMMHKDHLMKGPLYAEGGGWFNSLINTLTGDAGLEAAQARANELNRVNENLGIDAQLEGTTDQSRLAAEKAAILNELGLGGQRAGAVEGVLSGNTARALDRTRRLQEAADVAGVRDQLPEELPTRQSVIDQSDLLLAPLQLRTGGPALAKMKQPDGYTGATKKVKTEDEVIDGKFMSEHVPHVKKQGVRVGPLSKAVYKNEGGAVREMHYHNPLMAKPAGGKSEEK